MGRTDWTECRTEAQVEWLRRETGLGENYTVEPAGTEIPRVGTLNRLPFSTLALLEGGVTFPLHPLLVECLARWRVFTTQCTVNIYRIVMGVVRLNFLLELNLGFAEIMYCYRLQFHKSRVYLQIRGNKNFLVTELPDSSAGKDHHYVYVGGDLVDPALEYAARLPLEFGFKDTKKRKDIPLSREQKRQIHKVWAHKERSAASLLHYTPYYNHNIAQHKEDVTLSDTESLGIAEPETSLIPRSRRHRSSPEKQDPASTSRTDSPTASETMVRTAINLADRRKKAQSQSRPSCSQANQQVPDAPMDDRPLTPGPLPPSPPRDPQEGSSLSLKRKGMELDKPSKHVRSSVVIAHDVRGPRDQQMPIVPEVWIPRLMVGPDRPVFKLDSVRKPRVAAGLAEAFFLPKDIEEIRKASTVQVAESAISNLGLGMQHIKVLMEDLESRNSEIRATKTQLEQSFNRSNELHGEATSLKAALRASEAERKELLKGKATLEEALSKKIAEIAAAERIQASAHQKVEEAEGKVMVLEGRVKSLEVKCKEEYSLGMNEALEQIDQQLPILEEKQRRKGWFLALKACKIDPLKVGLDKGPPADDSSDEAGPSWTEEVGVSGEPVANLPSHVEVVQPSNAENSDNPIAASVEIPISEAPVIDITDVLVEDLSS